MTQPRCRGFPLIAVCDGVSVQFPRGLCNSSSQERRRNPSIGDVGLVSTDVGVRLVAEAQLVFPSASEHLVLRPSSDELLWT